MQTEVRVTDSADSQKFGTPVPYTCMRALPFASTAHASPTGSS